MGCPRACAVERDTRRRSQSSLTEWLLTREDGGLAAAGRVRVFGGGYGSVIHGQKAEKLAAAHSLSCLFAIFLWYTATYISTVARILPASGHLCAARKLVESPPLRRACSAGGGLCAVCACRLLWLDNPTSGVQDVLEHTINPTCLRSVGLSIGIRTQ